MAVSPTVRINVSGARGPRGAASGPLGLNSVGGDEINAAEADAIRDKIDPAKGSFDPASDASSDTIEGKLQQVVSPLDFGAATDASDSGDAVDAAIAQAPFGGRIWIPQGKAVTVDEYSGLLKGVALDGGKIAKVEAGWNYLLSSYGRRMDFVIGRGHDVRFRAGIADVGAQLHGDFFGDSRWANAANLGNVADMATPASLWKLMLANNGVRNPMVFTDRSQGGRSYADIFATNPAQYLGPTKHFMAFTGGVNRESDDPLVESQTIIDGFDALRQASYGDLGEVSLFAVTPISIHDLAGHRTNSWLEDWRGFWEELSFKYKIMVFDLFSLFNDSTEWGGLNGDNPFVHPNGDMTTRGHAECCNQLCPPNSLLLLTGNQPVDVTFQPSWANFGIGNYPVQVMLAEDGDVTVRGRGVPAGNTLTNNTKMWQCPNPNYHPRKGVGPIWASIYNGSAWSPFPFRVETDGFAYAEASASSITAISFDNCSWTTRV